MTVKWVKKLRFRKTQIKLTMDTTKDYQIHEMVIGRNNLYLWKRRISDVLISKGLKKALDEKKATKMFD